MIEIQPKPDGHGSLYLLTQAGRTLSGVLLALQDWGERWAELTPERAHPGVVLWSWVKGYLRQESLPHRWVLVRFDYPTVAGPGRRGWLLVEHGHAEICEKNPGFEEDLAVTSTTPRRLPDGIWAGSNGTTRSEAEASTSPAIGNWPKRCRPGTAASHRPDRDPPPAPAVNGH